jgi:hypothetical protein
MPTADTREAAEAPTYTVIIGSGLLDHEIAWRYDRAPLTPTAIDAERTLLGVYADAELDGDPLRSPADLIIFLGAAATVLRAETMALAGENHYQALTRALNTYNVGNGSADDWNTWRTPTATPEDRIDSLVRIMAHAQALLNTHR